MREVQAELPCHVGLDEGLEGDLGLLSGGVSSPIAGLGELFGEKGFVSVEEAHLNKILH